MRTKKSLKKEVNDLSEKNRALLADLREMASNLIQAQIQLSELNRIIEENNLESFFNK